METVKLGVIGCGNISDAYLKGAARSALVRVAAVADANMDAARAKAETYDVRASTVADLLADPEIAIVINLTIPAAHAEVNGAIIAAGKHVYTEKPFAVSFAQAKETTAKADAAGVRIGGAPDTFLGRGHQSVRKLIDAGRVGTITGGAATFATPGAELWHPNPFFFYQRGGGPVLDIGCYPITQLVNCLGPVASVIAHASRPRSVRIVGSGPRKGEDIPVEVFTTVNGILSFAGGANVALTASWDVWKHGRPPIELYGTEGTIQNPDPNFFGGPVLVSDRAGDFVDMTDNALPFGDPNREMRDGRQAADYRMVGVFDMAAAIQSGRPHRANGSLALHVLEVMEGLERAASEDSRIQMTTSCQRPEQMPDGKGEDVFVS
ncbi:Gfo/Idh/MocA family oxidoreductase [Acuticoccus sp. MNP-M23]|uniref:Gfo/Idh/MocA family protein n=1 Tax=Acuticoccus sp. MNP-M23 TaxID=3072793 RepID=UPI002815DD5B|nr:Gfo/Idh/MocA family oxidoreductase [Acuticoccus sp. MNP-M23]WMS45153.1 Gfo/Idh/MocA family oxidoreductase [Acuticoccus sp. MNP-M23]